MNLRHLEVFHAVMSAGSVSEAARRMHVSQPAVSTMLKHAESQLGVKLFERIGGRLRPTPEAEALVNPASNVFAGVENFQRVARDLRDGRGGTLMVASTHMLGHTVMPRAIAKFHAVRPEARVELHTMGIEIGERMAGRQFALGLGYAYADRGLIDLEPVGSMRIVCVMPRGHRLAERSVVTCEDLRDEPQICQVIPSQMGATIQRCFESHGVPITTVLRSNSHIASWFMVNEGAGVSLTFPIVNADAFPDIVTRPFEPSLELTVNMIFAKDQVRSRLAKTFAAAIREAATELGMGRTPC